MIKYYYYEVPMNIFEYIKLDLDEKPLDRIVTDGGMCAVFRSICCIGDSLSLGEFESINENNEKKYHDMFEYSWGQYIARSCGAKVLNFSKGGLTAKEYCDSFAEANGFWDEDKRAQAYVIALGYNDLFGLKMSVGSLDDVCFDDCEKNAETFAGYYCRIIQKVKKIAPDAKFFLVSMPRTEDEKQNAEKAEHNRLLHSIAEAFENTYTVDLYTYSPIHDEDFRNRFYMGGHMTPAGYILSARIIESYIDYIVRHNCKDFKETAFIGTSLRYYKNDDK